MIGEFASNDVAGIGFAVGIERILMLLENTGVEIPQENAVKLYIAPMGEKESEKAFELSTLLRTNGISCDIDHMQRGIKAQFKYADKIGAKFVAVLGSNELSNSQVKVKNMADGVENLVDFENLVDYMKKV